MTIKYDLPVIRLEILRALRNIYPDSLSALSNDPEITRFVTSRERTFYETREFENVTSKRLELFALLRVVEVEDGRAVVLLPALSLLASRFHRFEDIIRCSALDPSKIVPFIVWIDRFRFRCWRSLECGVLYQNEIEPLCSDACLKSLHEGCWDEHSEMNHTDLFQCGEKWLESFHDYKKKFCSSCANKMRDAYEKEREKIWMELPACFELPSWKDMKLKWVGTNV